MSTIPGISSTPPSATTTAKADQALGQDQFLTLLVAQLENQDPLNPTDATEFTAQLAQYSQLEQLFNLNDSMDELTNATSKSQSISALNLIGQDVVVEGNGFTLGDSPVDLGYKIDGTVTDLALTIKNGTGKIVATIAADNLNTGNHFVTWDGKDANGNTQPPGNYTFSITAASDDASATTTPLVRTGVTGVDLTASEPMVITSSGNYGLSFIYGAYKDETR
jgi:flagellar basal-body rod modification protein FlgD